MQAVNKAKSHISQKTTAAAPPPSTVKKFYTAKADGKIIKIYHADILYVEGLKEYVRFICQNGRYVVYESLKNLEVALPPEQFLRVHKSFIVAKNRVKAIQGNQLELEGQKIPISRGKKEEVVKAIFHER